jgi:hypothetical protein
MGAMKGVAVVQRDHIGALAADLGERRGNPRESAQLPVTITFSRAYQLGMWLNVAVQVVDLKNRQGLFQCPPPGQSMPDNYKKYILKASIVP